MKIASSIAGTTLFVIASFAGTNSLTVPGTADVWLAGQANGTVLQGSYPLNDVAPANSPVLASTGLNMTAGSFLTISATGTTTFSACRSASPDGNGCVPFSTASAGPYFGISPYAGPINALIGVFIGPGAPGGTAPGYLNFMPGSAQSQATVSPQLNQVFFIGDGLTGTGSGSVQQFIIPAGATRLYLASSDGAGANYDNSGSFTVAVSDSNATTSTAVPAASPSVLLVTGLLLLAVSGYLLKPRSRAA